MMTIQFNGRFLASNNNNRLVDNKGALKMDKNDKKHNDKSNMKKPKAKLEQAALAPGEVAKSSSQKKAKKTY
ncbi:MAG: hypothetical protein CVV56_01785 [Tenericutes bacterium HGW-Tenericutes-1]|jgi:hypothetical protein|nr:MAG: hypothetical protein CVV56_01785 [Tenericutes bacterium HGW-Tenericutes-1]